MTNVTVSAGISSGALSFNAGSDEFVYGTASGTKLVGGTQIVFSGGLADHTLLSYEGEGGQEIVSSGGSASFTMVSYGGQEIVSAGGSASFDAVSYGGTVTVTSGGIDSFATVSMGGSQTVLGGSAISATIKDDAFQIVASGGVAEFTAVTYFGSALVSAGGTSISATVAGGGAAQKIYSDGTTSDTVVASGAVEYVYSSGATISTTLSSGGGEHVSSGGTASFTTVSSGGDLSISSGGTAVSAVVSTGGSNEIRSGGTGRFATISSGGAETVFKGGQAISTTVDGDGAETVFSGGTAIGAMLNSNGGQYVSGVASFTLVSSGGVQFVYSRGATTGTTVLSGGAEFLFSGGIASGTVLDSGAILVVLPGATETGTVSSGGIVVSTGVVLVELDPKVVRLVNNGVNINLSNTVLNIEIGGLFSQDAHLYVENQGTVIGTTLNDGAFERVFSGGTARNTTVNAGGTEIIGSGAVATNTTVIDGGVQIVGQFGTAISTTVSGGGVLKVVSGGTAISATILPGSDIDLSDLPYASGGSATVSPSGLLTVQGAGGSATLQLAGDFANEHFTLSDDGKGYVLVTAQAGAPCYVRGTRILTGRGQVAIDDLRIGDQVRTVLGGTSAPVVWIGHRDVDCTRHPNPAQVWPIRIAPGAFAPGLPGRPLHLSPDHAVHVDDVLIPIKLLVNGSTIEQVPIDSVSYYHVELARHDVLYAEGMPAESYLDTGNRRMFANGDAPLLLHPNMADENDQARREAESCAPFVSDAGRVEPVWRWLAGRAEKLGFPARAVETTADPALSIRVGSQIIRPVSHVGNRYRFVLSEIRHDARLVSRSALPSQIRPWVDDSRRLGVAIERISIQCGTEFRDIALDDPRLSDGWWDVETDQTALWRWTNGDALLPVEGDRVMIEIVLRGTVPYLVTERCRDEMRRSA